MHFLVELRLFQCIVVAHFWNWKINFFATLFFNKILPFSMQICYFIGSYYLALKWWQAVHYLALQKIWWQNLHYLALWGKIFWWLNIHYLVAQFTLFCTSEIICLHLLATIDIIIFQSSAKLQLKPELTWAWHSSAPPCFHNLPI